MSRVLARLPPEDHQLTGKRSCKRRDSNGRPKCQNMRVSLLSAAFFLYWVLAIRRAARCRSGWGALSSVTSFLRKLQDEVPSQSLRFYLFDEPLRQDPTKIATAERWLGKTILFLYRFSCAWRPGRKRCRRLPRTREDLSESVPAEQARVLHVRSVVLHVSDLVPPKV